MRIRPAVCVVWLAAGTLAGGSGCGPTAESTAPRPFTLASFVLDGGYGTAGEIAERDLARAAETIAAARPDVLAVQFLQTGNRIDPFLAFLRAARPELEVCEAIESPERASALMLLSRLPVIARSSDPEATYRIGERQHRVDPGIVDVAFFSGRHGPVRVVAARLKDKTFHVSGQTEMRRSEARMLSRHIQGGDPDPAGGLLVVLATVNDSPDSAPVREITGTGRSALAPLRMTDDRGDAWTWREPDLDRYERVDYVFVRPIAGKPIVTEGSRILDRPELRAVSSHRALVVRLAASAPPDAATGIAQ